MSSSSFGGVRPSTTAREEVSLHGSSPSHEAAPSTHCARARRHGDNQLQFFSERHGLGTDSGRPDVLVSSTRWHQALRQAFKRLSEDQRAVLELSYFLGMSHGQIAEALNLPVGTVKSRILAGMRELRAMLPIIHRSMVA